MLGGRAEGAPGQWCFRTLLYSERGSELSARIADAQKSFQIKFALMTHVRSFTARALVPSSLCWISGAGRNNFSQDIHGFNKMKHVALWRIPDVMFCVLKSWESNIGPALPSYWLIKVKSLSEEETRWDSRIDQNLSCQGRDKRKYFYLFPLFHPGGAAD